MKYLFSILFLFLSLSAYCQFDKHKEYSYQDLNEILNLARTNNDNETLAEVYLKLGDYEGDLFAEYGKSLLYYNYAIEHFKVTKDRDGIKRANHAIARRYRNAGMHNDAIQILLNLANVYQEDENIDQLARVYFDLNETYQKLSEYDTAQEYLNKAININKTLNDSLLTLDILFAKIELFKAEFEPDSALILSNIAFDMSSLFNNKELAARALFHIGSINKTKGDYERAQKYLNKSLSLLPPSPYSELRRDIYRELADSYDKGSDSEEGYRHLIKYIQLNDSITNKNKLESFANIALKYGSKEKQTSIELLKIEKDYEISKNIVQRRTMYSLAIGFFIVLLSVYFIIKFYNQQITTTQIINDQKEEINHQKIRELEDNLKMNSMRSMIEGQEIERERVAKDLHDSLGGLLSTIKLQFDQISAMHHQLNDSKEYNQAYDLLDTAVEEVRNISRNLQPGSLQNFGLVPAIKDLINRFDADNYPEIDFQYYEVPRKMDKMIALSIYRIIQELLNNSIKHAGANEILIQLNTEENEIVIQYEDDGVGFDLDHLTRKGMGLENIKSRTNYMHGSLSMDTKPGKGMSVVIRVQYK